MAQKAIGLFITIDVMSCRGLDLFNKATLNLSIDKICSNVALRIWEFSLSFMFYSPKVVYSRAKILERLSQSFHFGANIANFIHDDLPFFKGTLMQIWKYANIFVFIRKQYVENFTSKHLLLFEICAREICERFV